MPFSRWAAAKSDKELPFDRNAGQIQYRHFINWETDVSGMIDAQTGTGSWKIQITNPGRTFIYLEQKVKVTIFLVNFGLTGMELYTWAFRKEEIETTIIGNEPITDLNPAWKYTIGGTAFSEFGILSPGGGGGNTNLTAYVTAFWESPVYNIDVPVGSFFTVKEDSWGLGQSTRPEFQFRYNYGALRLLEAKFGPFNELEIVRGILKTTNLQVGHSWRPFREVNQAYYIENCRNPSIVNMPDGRVIYGVMDLEGYWEFETKDSGFTINKVAYTNEDPLVKKPERIFGTDVTMPKIARVGDYRLAIAVKGNDLICRKLSDAGVGGTVVIQRSAAGSDYMMDVSEDGSVVIVNDIGEVKFESTDDGLYFRPITAPT